MREPPLIGTALRTGNALRAGPYAEPAEGPLATPAEQLVIAHNPFHPHVERLRMLRTELMLRHDAAEGANVIAVVSPCAGEGRSQVSAELAIAFAQLGQATLLVDADLRRPQQHALFQAGAGGGLSRAIGERDWPALQGVAGVPALQLLTAGTPPEDPLERLSSRHFEALTQDWSRHFEYVVIDTPPASCYGDALAVATIVGRVLTLSRARHTPYRETREMLRRLTATRAQVLGAVLNHF